MWQAVEDDDEEDKHFVQSLDRRLRRTDWNFVELDLYALFDDFADDDEGEAMLTFTSLQTILDRQREIFNNRKPNDRELRWLMAVFGTSGRISREDFFSIMQSWYGYSVITDREKIHCQDRFPSDDDLRANDGKKVLNPTRMQALLKRLNSDCDVPISEAVQVIEDATILSGDALRDPVLADDVKMAAGRWYIDVVRSKTGIFQRMLKELQMCSRISPLICLKISIALVVVFFAYQLVQQQEGDVEEDIENQFGRCLFFKYMLYFVAFGSSVMAIVLILWCACQPSPDKEPFFSLSICLFLVSIVFEMVFAGVGFFFLTRRRTCLDESQKLFAFVVFPMPLLTSLCYLGCYTCTFSNNIFGVGRGTNEIDESIPVKMKITAQRRARKIFERAQQASPF